MAMRTRERIGIGDLALQLLPGKTGRWIVRNGYLIAERIVGFN